MEISYETELHLLCIEVPTKQARLKTADIDSISNIAYNVLLHIHANGVLKSGGNRAKVIASEAMVGRFTPYTETARGAFGGLTIPLTIHV